MVLLSLLSRAESVNGSRSGCSASPRTVSISTPTRSASSRTDSSCMVRPTDTSLAISAKLPAIAASPPTGQSPPGLVLHGAPDRYIVGDIGKTRRNGCVGGSEIRCNTLHRGGEDFGLVDCLFGSTDIDRCVG